MAVDKTFHSIRTITGIDTDIQIDMMPTCVDGKAVNSILENRCTRRCPFTMSMMTDLMTDYDSVALQYDAIGTDRLLMGCRPLHIYLDVLNWVLTVSCRFRLGPDFWAKQVPNKRGDEVKTELKKVQIELENETDGFVILGQIAKGQTGNTGNMARVFFSLKWSKKVAKVLKIPEKLHRGICVMLEAMYATYQLNIPPYKKIANEMHDEYRSFCPWWPMSPSFAVLLFIIPIYQKYLNDSYTEKLTIRDTSEEVGETDHHGIRLDEEGHSCRTSILAQNKSILIGRFVKTDPKLKQYYKSIKPVHMSKISSDAAKLLHEVPAIQIIDEID